MGFWSCRLCKSDEIANHVAAVNNMDEGEGEGRGKKCRRIQEGSEQDSTDGDDDYGGRLSGGSGSGSGSVDGNGGGLGRRCARCPLRVPVPST